MTEQAFPDPHRTDIKGMSLRDYFAAKAMQAMFINNIDWIPTGRVADQSSLDIFADLAGDAYLMADAMLWERAK